MGSQMSKNQMFEQASDDLFQNNQRANHERLKIIRRYLMIASFILCILSGFVLVQTQVYFQMLITSLIALMTGIIGFIGSITMIRTLLRAQIVCQSVTMLMVFLSVSSLATFVYMCSDPDITNQDICSKPWQNFRDNNDSTFATQRNIQQFIGIFNLVLSLSLLWPIQWCEKCLRELSRGEQLGKIPNMYWLGEA